MRRVGAAEVEAQAKINLRLRTLARETTGYHQLETLLLRLTLADTVRIRHTPSARSLDVSGLPPGVTLCPTEDNLAWRAAEAYAHRSGWSGGFAIEIEKRIPVGGGLGGGSADAGAVLRIMETLAPAPVGEISLLQIASALGADVPFLTCEHAYVIAWGRGERMMPLTPPAVRPVLLVVPPFAVDTAKAYGWMAQSPKRTDLPPIAAVLDPVALSTWETIASLAINDFEYIVGARHPEIDVITEWLAELGASPAKLSGSGSVVYGVLPDHAGLSAAQVYGAPPVGRLILAQTAGRVEPVRRLE